MQCLRFVFLGTVSFDGAHGAGDIRPVQALAIPVVVQGHCIGKLVDQNTAIASHVNLTNVVTVGKDQLHGYVAGGLASVVVNQCITLCAQALV